MRLLIVGTCALLAVSACNMELAHLPTPNAENIIYITATPDLPTPDADGVIWITATPQPIVGLATPIPTGILPPTAILPTQPPTPFAQPVEALAQAEQQLRNGFYEQATQTFAAILAQGDQLDPAIRAQAAFSLGQAALREGLFDQAVSAFTQLITLFPQDERVAQAHFLRGDALLGLSRWAEAIADFERYLAKRPGLIDSYAYERIADAQIALGQFDAALVNYNNALKDRSLVPLLALRERVAQILIGAGRIDDAIAQYDAILAVARNAGYRASIDLLAAQALVESGRVEAGVARAQRVFDTYPETRSAYQAMQILMANNVPLNAYQRGRVAFNYGDFNGAISAFNEFSSTVTLDQIPADLYLMLGRAYREIGNPNAAVVAFQTIVQQYPTSPEFGAALLERGRTRFLSGDIAGAIDIYLDIARQYPALSETAAEALWRVGYLYGTNNDPVQSREVFQRLAMEYPNSSWASNGLLLAATAAVNAQQWEVAENLYGRIAAIGSPNDRAAAYLWIGRLALQRGDTNAAQSALRLARDAAPESFFAVRASDILDGREPFTPPAGYRWEFDEAADQAEAEAWLRATFNITAEGSLSAPSAALRADGRLIRGQELWAVGAFDEALREFTAILDEARANRDAVTSYQMAIILRDLGVYQTSIQAAADVIVAAGVPTLSAPPYIARMRFPIYYADLVLAQAARFGYDPLVQFALIRQESLFNRYAVSSAGATGLSQVMPATGRYLAQKLGYSTFDVSDLTRPYIAVEFGASYIEEQLRLFNGNIPATLAAYNAGPGRALDWVRLSGGTLDALMLTIQFQETRTYLERIYSHYAIYKALYGVP
ncbi:MAG: tetratricopeptide repeat protein [Anaerolinea sp.]